MAAKKNRQMHTAGIRQRKETVIKNQLQRYRKAFHVGQIITSEMNKDILFEVIINQANEAIESERSTVFLHDEENDELWSLVAVGMKKREIRIPSDYGVAGWVFQHRSPVVVNDAYSDPRFYPEVDKKSGFKTRNILCIPLINWKGVCIGALQSLNKISGDFTLDDKELLFSISNYVTIALENMKLFEELKDLNKARERTIHHLSHELKTPLAMLKAVVERFAIEANASNDQALLKRVLRGQRNIDRLVGLQEKIDDIWGRRRYEEKDKVAGIIEDAAVFVEICGEEAPEHCAQALSLILKRIESVYSDEAVLIEKVAVHRLLDELCDEALSASHQRNLELTKGIEENLVVETDRKILGKVLAGFLKNAIENTPDEGKIEISARRENDQIHIGFRDYGVGISPQNQNLIFGGFFHTQDTMYYSSKRPYDFNAGGAGADLLRIKTFSERYGFSVGFSSSRCRFIPNDSDECPGTISKCQFITDRSDCLGSGGSTFYVRFPDVCAEQIPIQAQLT